MTNAYDVSDDERQRTDALVLLSGEVCGLLAAAYLIIGKLTCDPRWRVTVRSLADRFSVLADMMRHVCEDEVCDLSQPPAAPPGEQKGR